MRKFIIVLLLLCYALPALASDTTNFCVASDPPPSVPEAGFVFPDADGNLLGDVYNQWYWNGNGLSSGHLFGFEAIVIQLNIHFFGFDFEASYVQMSLSDVFAHTYHTDSMLEFDVFPSSPGSFDLEMSAPGKSFSATGGGGSDHLVATFSDGAGYDIYVDSLKDPSIQFFGGFATYQDVITGEVHGAQDYYSRTRLDLSGTFETPSTITTPAGGTHPLILGEGWFDRQTGGTINDVSWEWLSIRLIDGTDVHAWVMKSTTPGSVGNEVLHVVNILGSPFSDAGLGVCKEVTLTDFTESSSGSFVSPRDSLGFAFPTLYHLVIPAGPDNEAMNLYLLPAFNDQVAIDPTGLFLPVWEGLGYVVGTKGGHLTGGFGYAENTHQCCI